MAKQLLKIIKDDNAIGGWLCMLTAIGLLIFSAICPPPGVIDGSILAAGSLLLAFKIVDQLPNIIKSIKDGKQLIIHHNNTDVTINSETEHNGTNNNSTLPAE